MPGLQPLKTDIDAFRTVFDYRCYRLTNRAVHIDPNADRSLHKLNGKVQLPYPTLEPFFDKDRMELLGFL